jgi:hypothetical protein
LRVTLADGTPLYAIALNNEPTWTLRWLHSVANTPVSDTFAWRNGTMLLTDHRTEHLDIAGLGYTPGRGELRDDGKGGHWVANIDEAIPGNTHRFIIGSAGTNMALVHGGRVYPLSTRYPGARARIEVTQP